MSFYIAGIGTALPEGSIVQGDAAELACRLSAGSPAEARLVRALYKRSAVGRRHSVLLQPGPGGNTGQTFFARTGEGSADHGPTTRARMEVYQRETAGLALRACGAALEQAGVEAGAITHLITVSCSGFAAPGTDLALIEGLGLPRGVARTHVGFMGCHGAFNALRVADGFVAADAAARVLICAVELCSLHFQYQATREQHVANALFADGAGAIVGQREAPAGGGWRFTAGGSTIFAASAEAMTWRIGDHGFVMTLSARVPELIGECLRPWLEEWLITNNYNIAEIKSWAIHPGGPRIVDAVETALGLEQADSALSREVLAEHGNMSSPTIIFIIKKMMEQETARPCVALGFGPGLAAEAMVLE